VEIRSSRSIEDHISTVETQKEMFMCETLILFIFPQNLKIHLILVQVGAIDRLFKKCQEENRLILHKFDYSEASMVL